MPAIRQVGRLRHKIAVLARAAGLDDLGRTNRGNAWQVTRWLRGEWRDLSGQERELARQIVADVSVIVTIRHLSGLDTTMRLRRNSDGRTVEIRAVLDPDGHGRQHLVYCSEAK
jgi:SPP1 family predicted phage head-tail adaptor